MTKQKKSIVPDSLTSVSEAHGLKQLSRTLSLSEADIHSALQVLASSSVFSVSILLQLCLDLSQTSISWQANMKAHLLVRLLAEALQAHSGGSSSRQVKKLESAFYTLYPELFLGVVHVG